MSEIQNLLSEFEEKVTQLFDIVEDLTEDQINWKLVLPLGDDYWSVRQIIAHIEEVHYFWLKQVKELLVDPSGNCGRGRPEDLAARQAAVDNAYERDLSEMLDNIKKSIPVIRQELGSLTDEQVNVLVSPKPTPVPVQKTLLFIISHVYPEHIEMHIKHIQRTLFAYSQYH